ncbi:hypothetical protein ACP70R_024197 [Stipagrostis hirtigluma subsp. patula]
MSSPLDICVFYGNGEVVDGPKGVELRNYDTFVLRHPNPETTRLTKFMIGLLRQLFNLDPKFYTVSVHGLWSRSPPPAMKWEMKELCATVHWHTWVKWVRDKGAQAVVLAEPCPREGREMSAVAESGTTTPIQEPRPRDVSESNVVGATSMTTPSKNVTTSSWKTSVSVIYHAEGMFSKGRLDGVQRNRSCPFEARELPDPKRLPSSFQEARRWIMSTFGISEDTHGITLRHIVRVRNPPSSWPYHMLIDIVGDDAWMAFQDLASRAAEGSFVLYAQWHAKAAEPASDGAATVATATATPAAAEEWPACKHGKPCTIETDWGRDNPGRRFYRCPLFADASKDCGFSQWLDEEFPERATEHIRSLLSDNESLQQQVDNLRDELEELRRRNTIDRGAPPPRDGQDGDPRPRKTRRLARDN